MAPFQFDRQVCLRREIRGLPGRWMVEGVDGCLHVHTFNLSYSSLPGMVPKFILRG
jgi:hypothetical protein